MGELGRPPLPRLTVLSTIELVLGAGRRWSFFVGFRGLLGPDLGRALEGGRALAAVWACWATLGSTEGSVPAAGLVGTVVGCRAAGR